MAVIRIYRKGLLNRRKKMAHEAELRTRISRLDGYSYEMFKRLRRKELFVIFIEDLQWILMKCGLCYTIDGLRDLVKRDKICRQKEITEDKWMYKLLFTEQNLKGYKVRMKWFRNRIIISQAELIVWMKKLLKEGMTELKKRGLLAKEVIGIK